MAGIAVLGLGIGLVAAAAVVGGVGYGAFKVVQISAIAISNHRDEARSKRRAKERRKADQERREELSLQREVEESVASSSHLMISGRAAFDPRGLEVVWSENLFPLLRNPFVFCEMEWVWDDEISRSRNSSLPPFPNVVLVGYDQMHKSVGSSSCGDAKFVVNLDPNAQHLALYLNFGKISYTEYQRQHLSLQLRLVPAADQNCPEDVEMIEDMNSRGLSVGQFPFFFHSLADLSRQDYYALSVISQNAITPRWSYTTLDHSLSPVGDNPITYIADFLLTPHLLCDATASNNGMITFSAPVRLSLMCWDRFHRPIEQISENFAVAHPDPVAEFHLADVQAPEISTFALISRPAEDASSVIKRLEMSMNMRCLGGRSNVHLNQRHALVSGHRLIHHVRDAATTVVDPCWHLINRLDLAPCDPSSTPENQDQWMRQSFGIPLVPLTVLDVTIHGAHKLAPKDSNGLSDPYVKTYLEIPEQEKPEGKHFRFTTVTKSNTLNPTWENAVMRFHLKSTCSLGSPHLLKFLVFDYDNPLKSDFEGKLTYDILQYRLPIRQANMPLLSDPEYPGEKVTGLLQFSIIPREENAMLPVLPHSKDIKSKGRLVKSRSRSSSFRK